MSDDMPLHVRVAEALGWTDCKLGGGIMLPKHGWKGWPPGSIRIIGNPPHLHDIPIYEDNWSATGPLIEKYEMSVFCLIGTYGTRHGWRANIHDEKRELSEPVLGDTPLIAVCNLILAMKKAGKL